MRLHRSNFASASSVSLFPRERMHDITSERFCFEKTSITTVSLSQRARHRLPTAHISRGQSRLMLAGAGVLD